MLQSGRHSFYKWSGVFSSWCTDGFWTNGHTNIAINKSKNWNKMHGFMSVK